MSKTAFFAGLVKHELDKLNAELQRGEKGRATVTYIITRLWPDLESAIKQEAPPDKAK